MFNLTKREKVIILTAIIVVAACIGTILLSRNKAEPIQIYDNNAQPVYAQQDIQQASEDQVQQEETKTIIVDVKGQVRNPGIVTLEEGKRVYDAIEYAGGITENGNLDAINLAAYLKDGQCIYVPEKGENLDNKEIMISQQISEQTGRMININTANEQELMELPGIGPATAKKIIDFRSTNNGFASIEDIMNVSGIGEKKFQQIKDLISIH
ncbi:helix-hairpin-helix domain-containing protein [Petroclostridium sp. X23]|uniref:helix-hairpin-helix domain-containing protein n=1 Tax=Petroclostridium sp. X23 TaxID=3045146 RepID=UPI0024ADAF08|nr:helix-hairpin-helix domain-containing protein [Petroclostridium sp. X23]WHH58427.1 helix-hairpin-helix domain-containing protein [Petroclostridium sp. X23]